MITLQSNKLNLILGGISSGKTPLALNLATDALHTGLNVLYVTTDVDQHNIKRSVHCLYNDVNFVEIKYAKDERTPVNLVLPPNITVVDYDSIKTIEDIKKTYNEVLKLGKIDLLVIDNVNFIKTETDDKSYKDRLDWINMSLNEFANEAQVTILATLNLLKVIDNEPADFMLSDMGNFIHISRLKTPTDSPSKEFEVIENNKPETKKSLTLSYKNLKMSDSKLTEIDEEAYFGM